MRLKDIGERRAIDRIWNVLGKRVPYDDCVYIEDGNIYRLYTTDFIGEGVHFMRDWEPRMVGAFFASINLSDIAAMGGVPEFFMAAMSFPDDIDVGFVDGFVEGMKDVLSKFDVVYRGGDLKESKNIGMSGFAVGYVEKERILRRDALKDGEYVYITGELGKQAAGYFLWKNGYPEGVRYLMDVHPRLEEGRRISKVASSCIDLSDGIQAAAKFLGDERFGVRVEFDDLPIHKLAYEVSEDYDMPLEFLATMFGGEYELVYTSSSGLDHKKIGQVVEKEFAGIWKDGAKLEGEGYAHFGQILEKVGKQ